MSHEPSDASHYRPRFANPAGRISELENMLEFAKQDRLENWHQLQELAGLLKED